MSRFKAAIIGLTAMLWGRHAAAQAPYDVRIVYIVPAEKTPCQECEEGMAKAAYHLQAWVAGALGGGRTFKLRSPPVEVVWSEHDSNWFRTNPVVSTENLRLFYNAVDTAGATTGTGATTTTAIYIDVSGEGQSVGGTRGVAVLPELDVTGIRGGDQEYPGGCRWVGGLGHELGHALGLPHPPGCDQNSGTEEDCATLMYFGYVRYPDTSLTAAHKSELLVSPFISPVAEIIENLECSYLQGTPTPTPTATPVVQPPSDDAPDPVTPVDIPPALTSPRRTEGRVARPFLYSISASPSFTTVQLTKLPRGLRYDAATSSITGSPRRRGRHTVRVVLSNEAGKRAFRLTIRVR